MVFPVDGVSNDLAFADLASQGAIEVWTEALSSSAPLHTCLMAGKPEKIKLAQEIAGLLDNQQHFCEEALRSKGFGVYSDLTVRTSG